MSGIFDTGFQFTDPDLGPVLAKNWGDELWFFRLLPDGQWVSYRKCTQADMKLLSDLIQIEHGLVLKKG